MLPMDSMYAKQLLLSAATAWHQEKTIFSRQEIINKINEIKYLSSQKKVPRLTLRKEILHLEKKLEGINYLEQKLVQLKRGESMRVAALKRRIKALEQELALAKHHDIGKKVNKLSHLLGDHLAKKESRKNVAAAHFPLFKAKKQLLSPETINRVKTLQERVDSLKQELIINWELKTNNPEELKILEAQLKSMQDKLTRFYQQYPELRPAETKVEERILIPPSRSTSTIRHKIIFPAPVTLESGEQNKKGAESLPLPPPPKRN